MCVCVCVCVGGGGGGGGDDNGNHSYICYYLRRGPLKFHIKIITYACS